MNAKPWIFSLLTLVALVGIALFFAFILMWGMMHYKESVKPYAYALYGALSFVIILAAAVFAGPLSSWAAKKLFPGSGSAELFVCIAAAVLAVFIGSAALFIASTGTLAAFDDPLPREGSMMRVKFPEGTSIVHRSNQNSQTYDTRLIVRLDAAGWEEFQKNDLFRSEGLRAARAEPGQDLRSWNAFEKAAADAQEYRWTNHNEPALLRVLALRSDKGQVYVYLYLIRNLKGE